MGKVLLHNVVLRENPPTGPIVTFLAGAEVPDWALEQCGEHLFTDAPAPKPEVSQEKPTVALPEEPPAPAPQPETLEVPKARASAATWRAFAEKIGVELAGSESRDEIVALVREQRPELFEEAE